MWRVIAATNTFIVGALLSKNMSIAAKIAGTDTLVKTALFFVYERIWAQIEWGKVYNMVSMTLFHVRARVKSSSHFFHFSVSSL